MAMKNAGAGMRGRAWQVWLAGLTTVLLWGTSFVLTQALYSRWGPLWVAAGRWLLAGGVFALLLPSWGQAGPFRQALRCHPGAVLRFALIGVTGLYAVQNLALTLTTAANASVLGNLVPLFAALLSGIFLGERLTARLAGALGLGTLGAVLFSLEGAAVVVAPAHLVGDGLVLLSALAGAVYVVQGKALVDRYPPSVVTGLAAILGGLFLLPLALAVEGIPRWPGWMGLGGLLGLGLGASVVANLTWWYVAARLPVHRAVFFILLIPVVGALAGNLLLGDPMTPAAWAGTALILAALYLAQG